MSLDATHAPSWIDVRASVLKQRRVFVSFSVALFLIHSLGVGLDETLQLGGLALEIDRPQLLKPLLWLSWAWATWRYYTYQRTFADPQVDLSRQQLYEEEAFSIAEARVRDKHVAGEYEKNSSIPRTAPVRVWRKSEDQFRQVGTGAAFAKIGYQLVDQSGVPQGASLELTEVLTAAELKRARFKASARHAMQTPYWADYKAPYLFILFPPAGLLVEIVRSAG